MSGFNSFALDFSSEALMERLQLCRERLETFSAEGLSEESGAYFRDLRAFALEALEVFSGAPSAGERRRLCSRLYGAPEAPTEGQGAELGLLLSVWSGEFRDLIRAACEKNLKDMTVLLETFLQLLTAFEEAWAEQGRLPDSQEIKDILYSYVYDYCLEFTLEDLERALRPAEAPSCRWLWDADFGEPDWIYEPGLPVTEAECRLAADFGGLSEELLRSMAEDCREEALRLWQEAYGRTAPPGALFLRFPKAAAPLGRAVARQLQEAGKAWFYWDYDIFYTRLPREKEVPYMHEAGEFILRNLKEFPNQLPESLFDVMRHPKQVSFIASPTENAQARYLSEALASFDVSKEASKADTAVVLCNEALLLPVIHSIPPAIRNVNITMGFPLAQTPAYSFVNALLTLQTTGYRPKEGYYVYEAVNVVLRHPYVRSLSAQAEALERRLTESNRFYPFPSELKADDFLEKVFVPQQSPAALCGYLSALLRDVTAIYRKEEEEKDIFSQLYREALFKCYTYVNRLQNLIEKEELTLQTVTLTRLLARLMTSANIPFHGEPVLGLQVMGVLETRNLDFRNLIILSLNEGQLPKSGGEVSFIPYNLRKAFGMTTIDHKNAVYAYYFYRLMQRAEKVALAYNTSSEGLNKGEMSR